MVFPCSSMSFPIECLSYPYIYIYIISIFFAHDGYYQYITHIPHVLFLISGLLFNLWDMMQLGNVEVTNSSLRLSWVRGPGNLWNPTLLRLVLQDILWNWGGFIGKMTSLVHDRRWPAAVATKQWVCFHWSHLLVPTFAEWLRGSPQKKRKTSVENGTSIVVTQMDRKLENRWKPINGYCNYHLWRPGKTFRHIFRLPRSLASLEAKKSRIIAFFWKAVWDFEILRSFGWIPGSISELSLLNLYSSTVLHLFLCAFFSIFFSSQRRRGVWKVRKPSTCWSPMTNFDITAASRWDPWLRTGSTDAFVDLSGLEGGGLCVFWAGIEEGWLEDGSPFLYGGVENRSTSFLWFFSLSGYWFILIQILMATPSWTPQNVTAQSTLTGDTVYPFQAMLSWNQHRCCLSVLQFCM